MEMVVQPAQLMLMMDLGVGRCCLVVGPEVVMNGGLIELTMVQRSKTADQEQIDLKLWSLVYR